MKSSKASMTLSTQMSLAIRLKKFSHERLIVHTPFIKEVMNRLHYTQIELMVI